jgi:hypothetical protein
MGDHLCPDTDRLAHPPKPPGDPPPEPMGDPQPEIIGDPDPEPEEDPDGPGEPIWDPDEY